MHRQYLSFFWKGHKAESQNNIVPALKIYIYSPHQLPLITAIKKNFLVYNPANIEIGNECSHLITVLGKTVLNQCG